MTTTFETAAVGDAVWSTKHGWGTVSAIRPDTAWPVRAEFDRYLESYTWGGVDDWQQPRTLYWDELVIPTKPLPKLKVDTLVRVWDKERSCAKLRYFSHFEGTRIYTYHWGATSITADTTNTWENWEVVAV